MNEKQQMITLTAYLYQRWQDEFLSWNPDDYDGITEIRFPAGKIWRPDTAVLNSAYNSDGLIKSDTNVVVAHTGHVLWTVPVFLKNSCKFRIRYVPFDIQVCKYTSHRGRMGANSWNSSTRLYTSTTTKNMENGCC
ncbi:acetylcholine receptor subunit alpha-1-A-like [Ptychodera flava]|uniref:acetylcholine receptor subunit alpha-1-A-like n=1 Tax=Ptychodera flava TaxID=63121 RepID=UPI00396A51AB